MSKIRSLKPAIWTDEDIGTVSLVSRMVFIGMITLADDEGRLRAAPALLRGQLFPYDDDVTVADVEASLLELNARGRVRLYGSPDGRQRYAEVVNFTKHQRIRADRFQPSQLPAPSSAHPLLKPDDMQGKTPGRPADDGHVPYRRGEERRGIGEEDSKGPSFSKPTRKAPIEDVKQLFEHWKQVFSLNGNTVLDDKRKKRIRWAIDTYGIDTAKQCLDGYAKDDWPDRKKHCDISLFFRDAAHVERGLAIIDKTRQPQPGKSHEPRYSRNVTVYE